MPDYRAGSWVHPEGGWRAGSPVYVALAGLISVTAPAEITSGATFVVAVENFSGGITTATVGGVDVSASISQVGNDVTLTAPLLWDNRLLAGTVTVTVADVFDSASTTTHIAPPADVIYYAAASGLPTSADIWSMLEASELTGIGPVLNGWYWALRDPNNVVFEGSVQPNGTGEFTESGLAVFLRVAVPDGLGDIDWSEELQVQVVAALSAPINLQTTMITTTSARVSWDAINL